VAGRLPAEAAAAFAAEQAGLAAEGSPRALPGTVLDDAELLDTGGAGITLAKALDGRPMMLAFYRGA
jgi:hypothetical protein